MKRRRAQVGTFYLFLLLSWVFFAGSQSHAGSDSSRKSKVAGLYGALMGDPYPSAWGINAGVNLFGFTRVHAGFGSLSILTANLTAMNVGLTVFVPNWNLSPFVSGGYNLISSNATAFIVNGVTVANAPGTNLGSFVVQFGLEWQSEGGFLLAGLYTLPVGNAVWNGAGAPGLHIGYMFY